MLASFTESCKVGDALALVALDESTASQWVAAAGCASRNGEELMWCLTTVDYGALTGRGSGSVSGSFWCCTVDAARAAVAGVGLFTGEEWDVASDEERAGMIAKTMLEDAYTGNGGLRRNFESGGFETLEPAVPGDYTSGYVWVRCVIETNPETGEEEIVSEASGQSYGTVASWGSMFEGNIERGWYEII